jgi:hypothetical protein
LLQNPQCFPFPFGFNPVQHLHVLMGPTSS